MWTQRLATPHRNLERTTVRFPLDLHLASVNLKSWQDVSTNESLFEAFGVAEIELEARVPIQDVFKLAAETTPSAV